MGRVILTLTRPLSLAKWIVLGDTLTEKFTAAEIETVMARELGHHAHHDLPLGIIVQSLITLAGFWLDHLVMRWGIAAFGYTGRPTRPR